MRCRACCRFAHASPASHPDVVVSLIEEAARSIH